MHNPTATVPLIRTAAADRPALVALRSPARTSGVAAPAVSAPIDEGIASPPAATTARSAGGRGRPMSSLAAPATPVATAEERSAQTTGSQARYRHAMTSARTAAAR